MFPAMFREIHAWFSFGCQILRNQQWNCWCSQVYKHQQREKKKKKKKNTFKTQNFKNNFGALLPSVSGSRSEQILMWRRVFLPPLFCFDRDVLSSGHFGSVVPNSRVRTLLQDQLINQRGCEVMNQVWNKKNTNFCWFLLTFLRPLPS